MPIPQFDSILCALPPHIGDPRIPADLSPYPCTCHELCDQFATTTERVQILNGFLNLRDQLRKLGIAGFQWVGGSFMEDIEATHGRPPGDIDVITFVSSHDDVSLKNELKNRPELWVPPDSKANFKVDHYLINLQWPAEDIVENVRYWSALFSHRRDATWKGMLRLNGLDLADDQNALAILGVRP